MTKKEFLFFCKRALLCLLAGTAAGILLLLTAFALPTDSMLRHVQSSVEGISFELEMSEESSFQIYINQKRETFTDAIIAQNAIEHAEGKNIYERAMMVYRHDLEKEFWSPEESLLAVCSGIDTETMYLREYSRYWHGYLIFVKPLLLVFTWEQLLIFYAAVQLILLVVLEGILIWKRKAQVGIAVLFSYLLMKPVLMAASITMSICWILTLCILIYMLFNNDKMADKGMYPILFLISGMLTAYFDFLTYPVVTLGFPLCVYFLVNEQTADSALKRAVGYSIDWGIGYVGLWGMKWVVTDLTLHQGTIKDALWTIIGRTETIGGRPRINGTSYAIGLNFQEYDQRIYYIIMAVIGIVAAVVICAACLRKGIIKTIKKQIPFAIICAIPFVWIAFVQNHSAIHARFTFRILSITFLGIAGMGICASRMLSDKNVKSE